MASSAPGPLRPPPLSQHLRELGTRRDAWIIVVRNLIPVVGIAFFGWSTALTAFNYWFDGLTALAAILAALVPRAQRESKSPPRGAFGSAAHKVLTWLFLIGIVGLPYWIVLIPLHDLLLSPALREHIARTPALWITFGAMAASHFWKAFHVGYDAMPEERLKQCVRWDVYLLILRAIAMFEIAANGFVFVFVPVMAIVLTYFEIWPERVIGMVFGDPSKLHEIDPGNRPARKRRKR